MTQTVLTLSLYESPIGPLTILMHEDALCAVEFEDRAERLDRLAHKGFGDVTFRKAPLADDIYEAFDSYFEGNCNALESLQVSHRGSAFEKSVWEALRRIPAGQTRSYGALAEELGSPGSARAVGRANGLNPISIVVPCHRVIGADGSLTGYAGGVERKAWLLRHEGSLAL